MKSMRIILTGLITICVLVSTGQAADDSIRMETVMVPMPDGVHLSTDVYYPDDADLPAPVILMRLPYGSKGRSWFGKPLAEAGYVAVIQNVRGQNGSEGQFFPFLHEGGDGVATVDWLVAQPWCDGHVGLWGSSYAGYCAFEIASSGHPAVAAVYHISGWADLEPFLAHDGAFRLMAHLRWFYSYASGQPDPPEGAWEGIFRTTPISSFFGGAADAIGQMAAGGYPYENIQIPVFHVTGWHDYIYPMVLETYDSLAALANPPEQRLLIGPWYHNGFLNGWTTAGDVDFGEKVKVGVDSTMAMTVRWFDHAIRSRQNGLAEEPPVKVFVMGDNEWRTFEQWPPRTSEASTWYIGTATSANSATGDGFLRRTQPDSGPATDTFTYNPHNPVPTYGGALFHFFPKLLGPRDQAEIEQRPDVLVYTSEPLEEPMTILGSVRAVVYASTTGIDTDVTAKLVSVRPDGYARHIVDGIARGSYTFEKHEGDTTLIPGQTYEFEIDLNATAFTVPEGNRLRLDISSSNFPRFDRNPNTGVSAMEATEFETVEQTVFHNNEYPSRVMLPVLK